MNLKQGIPYDHRNGKIQPTSSIKIQCWSLAWNAICQSFLIAKEDSLAGSLFCQIYQSGRSVGFRCCAGSETIGTKIILENWEKGTFLF